MLQGCNMDLDTATPCHDALTPLNNASHSARDQAMASPPGYTLPSPPCLTQGQLAAGIYPCYNGGLFAPDLGLLSGGGGLLGYPSASNAASIASFTGMMHPLQLMMAAPLNGRPIQMFVGKVVDEENINKSSKPASPATALHNHVKEQEEKKKKMHHQVVTLKTPSPCATAAAVHSRSTSHNIQSLDSAALDINNKLSRDFSFHSRHYTNNTVNVVLKPSGSHDHFLAMIDSPPPSSSPMVPISAIGGSATLPPPFTCHHNASGIVIQGRELPLVNTGSVDLADILDCPIDATAIIRKVPETEHVDLALMYKSICNEDNGDAAGVDVDWTEYLETLTFGDVPVATGATATKKSAGSGTVKLTRDHIIEPVTPEQQQAKRHPRPLLVSVPLAGTASPKKQQKKKRKLGTDSDSTTTKKKKKTKVDDQAPSPFSNFEAEVRHHRHRNSGDTAAEMLQQAANITPKSSIKKEAETTAIISRVFNLPPCYNPTASALIPRTSPAPATKNNNGDVKTQQGCNTGIKTVPTECFFAFSKKISTSDAKRGLGRIVIPKAAAEKYLPYLPDTHNKGILINLHTTMNGAVYCCRFKFWHNGSAGISTNGSKRMYLLDECHSLVTDMKLEPGDWLDFYVAGDGRYIVDYRSRNGA